MTVHEGQITPTDTKFWSSVWVAMIPSVEEIIPDMSQWRPTFWVFFFFFFWLLLLFFKWYTQTNNNINNDKTSLIAKVVLPPLSDKQGEQTR